LQLILDFIRKETTGGGKRILPLLNPHKFAKIGKQKRDFKLNILYKILYHNKEKHGIAQSFILNGFLMTN